MRYVVLCASIPRNKTTDLAVKLIFNNKLNIKIIKKYLKKPSEFAASRAHIFLMDIAMMKMMA